MFFVIIIIYPTPMNYKKNLLNKHNLHNDLRIVKQRQYTRQENYYSISKKIPRQD